MATITLQGNEIHTLGQLPNQGQKAPDFKLTNTDLKQKSLSDYKGHHLILNIFPSVDTGVCAQSVRSFNEKANNLKDTKVLCISKDLPFAQSRFCGAEGLDNVECLSDFKDGNFGKSYGVTVSDSAFEGLLSRAVVVINADGEVIYTQQVGEIGDEPDYDSALDALS